MFNPIRFPARAFVDAISSQRYRGFANPWAGKSHDAEIRRELLSAHLACNGPQFLFVSDVARTTDAMHTGIPLCSEYAAISGVVPRIGPVDRLTNLPRPAFDPLSSDLWKALGDHGAADRTICFTLVPFCPDEEQQVDESHFETHSKWFVQILRWYPDITVVSVGTKSDRVLKGLNCPHMAIKPPARTGASLVDQIFQVVRAVR